MNTLCISSLTIFVVDLLKSIIWAGGEYSDLGLICGSRYAGDGIGNESRD